MASMDELERLEKEKNKKAESVETLSEEGLELDIMSLENHVGWKAIVKVLKEERDGLEAEIFDINNKKTKEEKNELLIRRYYLNKLINMPQEKGELFRQRKDSKGEQSLEE
jgi:hypothetical protein